MIHKQHVNQHLRQCRTDVTSLQHLPQELYLLESGLQLTQLIIELSETFEVFENLSDSWFSNPWYSFKRHSKDMLCRKLTSFSIKNSNLFQIPKRNNFMFTDDFLLDFLCNKSQKFESLRNIINLNNSKLLINSSIEKCTWYSFLIFSKRSSKMSLEQIVNMTETTILQPVFLLLVPTVKNRTHQIISLLSLYHVIQYLVFILPHEITNGEITCLYTYVILLSQLPLKEILFLLIFDLSSINKQIHLILFFKTNLPLSYPLPRLLHLQRPRLLLRQERCQHLLHLYLWIFFHCFQLQIIYLSSSLWRQFYQCCCLRQLLFYVPWFWQIWEIHYQWFRSYLYIVILFQPF